jgi:glycosyltransferase EpsD
MPKVLICASTISHINNFHLPYLKFFKDEGFEVHLAVSGKESTQYVDVLHPVPIRKSFLSSKNILAVLKLRDIIKTERFNVIILHTTLAAFIARLGVVLAGKGSAKVINTVHGYFFWNGCGVFKKRLYRLPELLLRGVTDCVVVMNNEDYTAAQKLVKKGGLVVQVPGMGADASRFIPASDEEKRQTRRELGISVDAFTLVYAAEFSKRKNHAEIIQALAEIKKSIPRAVLILCGTGALLSDIKAEVDALGLHDNVRFPGLQSHMEAIYKACDLALSTSKSEGLPFNVLEAQLCALPVVASKIRGHTDLIEHGVNGWLYTPGDTAALAETILSVYHSPDRGRRQGTAASLSAKRYSLEAAYKENTAVYKQFMVND